MLAVLLFSAVCYSAWAQRVEKVEYLADSIAEKSDNHIRLLGGSAWILSGPSTVLVASDLIIVLRPVRVKDGTTARLASAYVEGDEISVTYEKGPIATQVGLLTRVIEALSDGAVLRLGDGSLLSVSEYDQFHTSLWLPPYKALLTNNGLRLYNLKKGKKVSVNPIK